MKTAEWIALACFGISITASWISAYYAGKAAGISEAMERLRK